MAITKIIKIDDKEVAFKASAAIPRIYRLQFGRDIFRDLKSLERAVSQENETESGLDMFSLEMFENIAFLMAKHADGKNVPNTPEEWLDQFETFSIYQVLPEIIKLWGKNLQTQIESKKKFAQLNGK